MGSPLKKTMSQSQSKPTGGREEETKAQLHQKPEKHPGVQSDQKPMTDSKQAVNTEDENVKKVVKERIGTLRNVISVLDQAYEENKSPIEAETLKLYYDDLTSVNKTLSEKLEYLLTSSSAGNEALVDDILYYNQLVDVISREFQNYLTKKSAWPEHRGKVLTVLREKQQQSEKTPMDHTGESREQVVKEENGGQGKKGSELAKEEKSNKGPWGGLSGIPETTSQFVPMKVVQKKVEEPKVEKELTEPEQEDKAQGEQRIQEEKAKEEQRIKEEKAKELQRLREEQLKEELRLQEEIAREDLRLKEEKAKEDQRLKEEKVLEEKAKAEQRLREEKAKEEQRLREEQAREEQRLREEKAREEQRIKEGKAKEEQRIKEEKAKEEERLKEVKRIQEEKAREEQRLREEKAKEEQRLKEEQEREEQRLREEKAKEEQRLREEQAREEQRIKEEKAKEEQRLKEEQAREEQRIREEKAKEEQRLREEQAREEQRIKEEKAKEEQRIREEKAREERAAEEQRLKEEKEREEQRIQEEKAQEEQKQVKSKPAPLNDDLTQSVPLKNQKSPQNVIKGLAQSMKLDHPAVAQKFADELKLMEQSIKVAKTRATDMEKIQENIKLSFVNRNKKPPNYKEALDKNLLTVLEDKIETLKKEKEADSTENKAAADLSKSMSPQPSPTRGKTHDFEGKPQIDQLLKQIEEYRADADNMRKKNRELESTMQAIKSEISKTKSREDVDLVKKENQKLLEMVNNLENLLQKIQHHTELLEAKESSENREKLQELTTKKEKLESNLKQLKREHEERSEKLSEYEYDDANLYVGNQANYQFKGSYQPKTSYKTEFPQPYPRAVQRLSPESDRRDYELEKYLLKRSPESPSGSRPSRNIFAKTKERLSHGSDEYSPEGNTSHDLPVKIGVRQEGYNPISQTHTLVHEMKIESPSREVLFRGVEFQSPSSRKIESASSGKRPRNIFSSTPGNKTFDSQNEDEAEIIHGKSKDEIAVDSDFEEDPRKIRGEQVLSEVYTLKGLKILIDSTGPSNCLLKFKNTCLKSKSILYENDSIEIGTASSIINDLANPKHVLKMTIYFGNKLEEDIQDFQVKVIEGINTHVILKPQTIESVIPAGKQVKQQLMLSFSGMPFSCLKFSCEGFIKGKHEKFSVYVPNLLTKFMQFKPTEAQDFRKKWKSSSFYILKTEPIRLDENLIDTPDFKKFFAGLIDLRPQDDHNLNEKATLKLAGVFELDIPHVEYLMKINVLPSGQAVFQVAAPHKHCETAVYLLQTLAFIFSP